MALTAVLIGSNLREVGELLRAAGLQVVAGPVSELGALTDGASAGDAVLVLDVRDCNRLPDGLAAVRRAHPAIGAVMVASAMEPALMLEAMRAGVTEYVAEPLTGDELTAAVRRVAAQRAPAPQRRGRVIALVGAKGGVGTTMLAVNVAATLAKTPSGGTLVIDLHLGDGDAALFLGAEPHFSVLDALDNTARLDETFLRGLVVRTKAGPDVLASPARVTSRVVDTTALKALIDFAARQYRYVVLDCPRDAGVLDGLDAVATIVVVASQELGAVRNAGQLATALQQRYGKGRVTLVVNRFDRSADIAQRDIEQATGRPVRQMLPNDYRRSLDALNKGRPLVLDNHSKLAGSLTRLANDLVEGRGPEAPGPRAGIFGQLTGRN